MARLLLFVLLLPDAAQAGDETLCQRAIAAASSKYAVSRDLLTAIAIVESGRLITGSRQIAPWPWTINVGGAGQVFATQGEAVATVRTLQSAGLQSIDVGCLQINLAYHPHAFPSVEDAFDPTGNADYAARFVLALHAKLGTLGAAITAYHSQTPDRAADYARRILAVWPAGARFGLSDPADPVPAPPPFPILSVRRSQIATTNRHVEVQRLSVRSDRGSAWPQKGVLID